MAKYPIKKIRTLALVGQERLHSLVHHHQMDAPVERIRRQTHRVRTPKA